MAHNIVDKPYVASAGKDNADVHTALDGVGELLKYASRWHKIGCGEDNLSLSALDNIVEKAGHSATTARLRPVERRVVGRGVGYETLALALRSEVVLEELAKFGYSPAIKA